MFRCLSWSLVGLLLLIICLPWIIAGTPLRHAVVTAVIDNPRLAATVDKASFGWFSPLKLEQLEILRDDAQMRVSVDRFTAEKSWLNLAIDAPDLGTLHLDQPLVEVVLDKEGISKPKDATKQPKQTFFTAVVRSAGFKLLSPQSGKPVIDLAGISTTASIQPGEDGRLLVIQPVKVLDHDELTPELCGQGLQLVAPILSDATRVEGEISFAMDQFQLLLDTSDKDLLAKNTNIRGTVELHSVEAGLKNPLLVGLVGAVSKLSGRQIPSRISVAEDTRVAFRVDQGRVYHEGMTFMLPELSSELTIRTSGFVGLDESLDLEVVVPVPSDLLRQRPLAESLAGKSLQLRVTGTIDKPKIRLENSAGLLSGVSSLLRRGQGNSDAAGGEPPMADAIIDLFGGLSRDVQPGDEAPAGALLERLRARREELQNRREAARENATARRRGGWFRRRDRD
jgi:hypothetical protein